MLKLRGALICVFLSFIALIPQALRAQGECFPTTDVLGYGQGFDNPAANVSEQMGLFIFAAGDINGDSYPDIAVNKGRRVTPQGYETTSALAFYSGLDLSPLGHFSTPYQSNPFWGTSGGPLGDINGDDADEIFIVGRADLIHPGNGRIVVYSQSADEVLYSLEGDSHLYGEAAAAVGDLDGDGVSEILAGPIFRIPLSYERAPFPNKALALYSGRTGAVLAVHAEPLNASRSLFSGTLHPIGDFNGDGTPDVLISGETEFAVYGGSDLIAGDDATPLYQHSVSGHTPISGLSAASIGDLNADGNNEFVVAFNITDTSAPSLYVFSWHQTSGFVSQSKLPDKMFDKNLPPNAVTNTFEQARAVSVAGDLNQDGIQELAVLRGTNVFDIGVMLDIAIIDVKAQRFLFEVRPSELQMTLTNDSRVFLSGVDFNRDGQFDIVGGFIEDEAGFNSATFNPDAPSPPPFLQGHLNSINPGRFTFLSIPAEINEDGTLQVCEDRVAPSSGTDSGQGTTGDGISLDFINSIKAIITPYLSGEERLVNPERASVKDALKYLRQTIIEVFSGKERKRSLNIYKRMVKAFKLASNSSTIKKRGRSWDRFSRLLSRFVVMPAED